MVDNIQHRVLTDLFRANCQSNSEGPATHYANRTVQCDWWFLLSFVLYSNQIVWVYFESLSLTWKCLISSWAIGNNYCKDSPDYSQYNSSLLVSSTFLSMATVMFNVFWYERKLSQTNLTWCILYSMNFVM